MFLLLLLNFSMLLSPIPLKIDFVDFSFRGFVDVSCSTIEQEVPGGELHRQDPMHLMRSDRSGLWVFAEDFDDDQHFSRR